MNSLSTISARTMALTQERPRGYSGAEEVRNRAAVTNSNETPHERRALNRLNKVLGQENAPRPDVPVGYYLDIRV